MKKTSFNIQNNKINIKDSKVIINMDNKNIVKDKKIVALPYLSSVASMISFAAL